MRLRNFSAVVAGLILFSMACVLPPVAAADEHAGVAHYRIEGAIHGGTLEIVRALLEESGGRQAVLIELDTPGGLLSETEEIVKAILNAKVPVIVYVSPQGARAGSAGTFITLSAHIAAMAPGTYIGAAHPVVLFGEKKDAERKTPLEKKILSASASFIEAIAKERGRNVEWARQAVLESASITADQAIQKNVVDLIAPSREDLLRANDGREVRIDGKPRLLSTQGAVLTAFKPPLSLRLIDKLASPSVIYLLLIATVLGIYLEAAQPGASVFGITAGICFILFLFASRVLPPSALGVLLILAALGLLIAELFTPTFGVLTFLGVVCFFLGSWFLFDPQKIEVRIPLPLIVSTSAAFLAISLCVSFLILRSHRRPQTAGQEGLIGSRGEVVDRIIRGEMGRVFVSGEYWNARSDQSLEPGSRVVVRQVDDLTLEVEKDESKQESNAEL